MNKLASRNLAIVSDIPGTTRDLIQTKLTLLGYNIILTDTAGLRETEDAVEIQGISLAKSEALSSHAVIFVVDVKDLRKEGEVFVL